MKFGYISLIAAALLLTAVFTSAQEDVQRPKPPVSMLPPAPFVTTNKPPQTPNTTASHETTTFINKTTTAHTTTVSPTTTGSINTTTPSSPNTTTVNVTTTPSSPNTTTANMSTTTGSPTTPPTPPTTVPVGNYNVSDGKMICIMVQAGIQVQVNNSKVAGTYVVQPNNTNTIGKCNKIAHLQLDFKEGFISMSFTTNDTTKMVYVSAVTINITYAFKTGEAYPLRVQNDSVQLFSVAATHSYSCKSESVFMGEGVYLKFSSQRMQAFNLTNNQFGPPDLCKADQPDYRVAIGVGVVLLLLIIIVVVAYLVSRRKRTDGYQSL